MRYWLLKSEPTCYSFDDQVKEVTTKWDGIRNYQARNNMQAMDIGDLCYFYHSSTKIPAVVGVVRVVKLYEPESEADGGDPRFGFVTVACVGPLEHPVTLKMIKDTPELLDMPLITQSRLSVMPLTTLHWETIQQLSRETHRSI